KEDERMEAAVKSGLMTVKVEDKTAIKAADTKTEDKDPNEIWVYLNGEKMIFDSEPYIENGTTRVPMRAIFEGLGASVDYDGETKTVTAQKGDTKIELVIGSDNALVNGKENKLLVPAEIKNSRTMVPLRFVSEALGAKVDWDGETKTITITSAK
ncbi:MAG: copper amine oxidase N-terminal domain-containing protein, partial [Firmicutes bacterium]|nr:copper amine oxidase N-terminal domain-containing protein [Bacillota bacterium]